MDEQTQIEKFYAWLKKCGNIYLADNEKMLRAFLIVEAANK